MIAPFTDMMEQVATYWPPAGNDGYGGVRFGAPIVIACRYQTKQSVVRSQDGQEVTSDSTVYVDRALMAKGYVALDDQSSTLDPLQADNARQIITTGRSPSLDADVELNVVYL
jgi:hypothetical protein